MKKRKIFDELEEVLDVILEAEFFRLIGDIIHLDNKFHNRILIQNQIFIHLIFLKIRGSTFLYSLGSEMSPNNEFYENYCSENM